MLPYDDALRIVLDRVPAPAPADVPLVEALGLALSRDVLADLDSPPFDASAMDGYAVRSADAAEGVTLRVVEEIPAGRVPERQVGPGEASAIMTGAPVPVGADAVVPVEQTEETEDGLVRLLAGSTPGRHIRPRGENRKAGDVVLFAGREIRAAEMAVLASVGCVRAPAHERPVVAVAATGDELVPVEAAPGPGQIRNSNSVQLMTQARLAGAIPVSLGIVEDTEDETRRAIREGLQHDVLLLSGGVSMGRRDLVVEALEREGVEIVFHRVAVKPGKPLVFGRRDRCLVFGLPGNPVSTFATFELFVRPAIRKLGGHASLIRTTVRARLEEAVGPGIPRRSLLPARWRRSGGEGVVRAVRWRGSGDPHGPAGANAFLVLPEDSPRLEVGATVDVVLLDGALEAEPAAS